MTTLRTFQQRADQIEPLADALERLAYRLRQGAISDDLLVARLRHLATMHETGNTIS